MCIYIKMYYHWYQLSRLHWSNPDNFQIFSSRKSTNVFVHSWSSRQNVCLCFSCQSKELRKRKLRLGRPNHLKVTFGGITLLYICKSLGQVQEMFWHLWIFLQLILFTNLYHTSHSISSSVGLKSDFNLLMADDYWQTLLMNYLLK